MSDIIDLLYRQINKAIDAKQLTDMMYGTVTIASPLSVRLTPIMIDLPTELLTLADSVYASPLTVDEKVLLLRVQGGNKYIVLSRLH